MNRVEVTVKNVVSGVSTIAPYSHEGGRQQYLPLGTTRSRPVKYQVPAYEVFVNAVGPFRAVRFGLRNTGSYPVPKRPCDAGLSHYRVCHPGWLPNYSPNSFTSRARPGAWQLIPGQNFLIHEGAGLGRDDIAGSIGCIEILDGKWGHFLWAIEDFAGVPCATLGAAKGLTVTLEAASYPVATWIP